jgi:chitin synthase
MLDNKAPKVEGVKVTTLADGKKIATVSLPSTDRKDIEAAYVMNQLKSNAIHKPTDKQSRDDATKQEDYFRQFRTNLVILWVLSNSLLIYIFTKDSIVNKWFKTRVGDVNINPYLSFIFWSVAAFGIFRFVFSFMYIAGFYTGKLRYIGHAPERKNLVSNSV